MSDPEFLPVVLHGGLLRVRREITAPNIGRIRLHPDFAHRLHDEVAHIRGPDEPLDFLPVRTETRIRQDGLAFLRRQLTTSVLLPVRVNRTHDGLVGMGRHDEWRVYGHRLAYDRSATRPGLRCFSDE